METIVLADGINSIAVHNGIVRIQFMRLGIDGKPSPCLELHVPMVQMKNVSDALFNVADNSATLSGKSKK